ncbi:unnamed protein product [Symbiodinium sp. CCMP2592]|nr:unnamed protein product [Symbiodinium sp. CCMP2592]
MEGAPSTPAALWLQLPLCQDERGDSSRDVQLACSADACPRALLTHFLRPEGGFVASTTPLGTAQCQEAPSDETRERRPSLISTEAPDDNDPEDEAALRLDVQKLGRAAEEAQKETTESKTRDAASIKEAEESQRAFEKAMVMPREVYGKAPASLRQADQTSSDLPAIEGALETFPDADIAAPQRGLLELLEAQASRASPGRLEDKLTNSFESRLRRSAAGIADAIFANKIDLRNVFNQWDLKRCGSLDEEEFQCAVATLGFDATPEVTAVLFKAFDLKGDGRVSCWEFTTGLRTLQATATEERGASTRAVSFTGGSSSSTASHLAGSDPVWGVGAGSGSGQSGASGGRVQGHLPEASLGERRALAREERRNEARERIREATRGRDVEHLREAIEDGERARLEEELGHARKLLAEEMQKARAKTALQEAMAAGDRARLQEAISLAQRAGVDACEMARFKDLLAAEPEDVSFLTFVKKELLCEAKLASSRGRSRSPQWALKRRIGRSVMPRTVPLAYLTSVCWAEERGRSEDGWEDESDDDSEFN